MSEFAVLLPAAGKSSRFRGQDKKPFATLDGRAVWLRAAELFVNRSDVAQTLLILAAEDRELFELRFAANIAFLNVKLVSGGAERFESVANALKELSADVKYVAVHDAVRPCTTAEQVAAVFAAAKQHGAALLAARVTETVKRVSGQTVTETVPREGLWLAQTPQVFRRDWLEDAYARRAELGTSITDDAQLVEAAGHPVVVVEGDATNVKITTRADLVLAEAVLAARPKPQAKRQIHPFADESDMWK